MLDAKAFANAASAVMAIWVVACAAVAYIAPDLLFSIAQSWMHTINLESVKATFTPNLGSILWGLISATGLTWVSTFGIIYFYNKWAK